MKRCMRFRHVVELADAEDAARVQDAVAIKATETARRIDPHPPGGSVFDYDFAFHLPIAAAAGNATAADCTWAGFGCELRWISANDVSDSVLEEHAEV
ncbi:FCD domain-containing protein [Falsirhodobacter deserti]|uniref:FCD domain-containing protein n=1 Tax=Falsirhodobacter deserti TaxID=1365611 RepID=UPI000FE357FF|nr:hypothetical protein [Falsirhodobacter deserti]